MISSRRRGAALFLDRLFRRLPVVDENACLIGQVSRRDVLRAVESMREQYLESKPELDLAMQSAGSFGVHSAMTMARAL